MMHTEEEAKKTWCPHAHVLGTLRQPAKPGEPEYVVASGSQNRGFALDGPITKCLCLASGCSQWRWNETKRTKAFVSAVQERIRERSKPNKPYPYNRAMAEIYEEIGPDLVNTEGYCGLAGKP